MFYVHSQSHKLNLCAVFHTETSVSSFQNLGSTLCVRFRNPGAEDHPDGRGAEGIFNSEGLRCQSNWSDSGPWQRDACGQGGWCQINEPVMSLLICCLVLSRSSIFLSCSSHPLRALLFTLPVSVLQFSAGSCPSFQGFIG